MRRLKKSWRWFGTGDPITLQHLREMDIESVVTSLYNIPPGTIWDEASIEQVQQLIEPYGMCWDVAESLPVSDDIKRRDGKYKEHIENYIVSLQNLAKRGVKTVCYNFMPAIDWVRTDLLFRLKNHGITMKFDYLKYVCFDLYILNRPNAEKDYDDSVKDKARKLFKSMTEEEKHQLLDTIVVKTQAFIHGAKYSSTDDVREVFLQSLSSYKGITRDILRNNLMLFLKDVLPMAEKLGIKMALHPDDPPFSVFGLPRIVSTADDLEWIFNQCPAPSNGLTFCAGSFSAAPTNNVTELLNRFAPRIYFAHLRNNILNEQGDFYESGHIQGTINMVEVVKLLLREQQRRIEAGVQDCRIPFRPDHGIRMLDDHTRNSAPGYPLIGRLKGLAEISGIEEALLRIGVVA